MYNSSWGRTVGCPKHVEDTTIKSKHYCNNKCPLCWFLLHSVLHEARLKNVVSSWEYLDVQEQEVEHLNYCQLVHNDVIAALFFLLPTFVFWSVFGMFPVTLCAPSRTVALSDTLVQFFANCSVGILCNAGVRNWIMRKCFDYVSDLTPRGVQLYLPSSLEMVGRVA
jgi:hypothetical protein